MSLEVQTKTNKKVMCVNELEYVNNRKPLLKFCPVTGWVIRLTE